jgi:hypothetical protein
VRSDSVLAALLAGRGRHSHPSRGGRGGEPNSFAGSPVPKNIGGEAANRNKLQPLRYSRQLVGSPLESTSPPIGKSSKMVAKRRSETKQTGKAGVGRATQIPDKPGGVTALCPDFRPSGNIQKNILYNVSFCRGNWGKTPVFLGLGWPFTLDCDGLRRAKTLQTKDWVWGRVGQISANGGRVTRG